MTTERTETYKGCTITIDREPYHSESPREWTNGSRMVLSHRRYSWPNEIGLNFDDFDSWAEIEEYIRKEYDVVGLLPVYAYDHGNVVLRAMKTRSGQFADPWDSGQAGFIFMDREGQAEVGTPDELVEELLVADVEVYTAWAQGDCFAFVVEDPNGEYIDSCGGFIGYDDEQFEYMMEQARFAVDSYDEDRDEKVADAEIEALQALGVLS